MRPRWIWCLLLSAVAARAQTVPTFRYAASSGQYTLVGAHPSTNSSKTIPAEVVPVSLAFQSNGKLVAAPDVPALLHSPVFAPAAFPIAGTTQYADAILRATFPGFKNWHTLLAWPRVHTPLTITVPSADGYVLTSQRSGAVLAIADIEFIQREVFRQIKKEPGTFILAVTTNTAFYVQGDATVCCSWGTHGVDSATGNSFVLASYLSGAPAVVRDQDVQAITEQMGEWVNDPLHDPLIRDPKPQPSGNRFPRWMRPATMRPGDAGSCGGIQLATPYFLLEPTDTNRKNNVPASPPFEVTTSRGRYHVQNIALLPWYVGRAPTLGTAYSFPDTSVFKESAQPCGMRPVSVRSALPVPTKANEKGHALVGYWTAYETKDAFPMKDLSPQWDVIIVAFASPDHSAPEGTLRFEPENGVTAEQLKAEIAASKARGKKVLISLGGGGAVFTMNSPKSVESFVSSVSEIVSQWGFDGIDLDFESPSLALDPGDTDFRHPRTPGTIHLIAGLRQLRQRFGSKFLLTLVPEGPQLPLGFSTYGGQFGSYLPIVYATGDMLTFVDVQDYNTPPLQGLDGEIYQSGVVDYHAAVADLLVRGFPIAGSKEQMFPGVPPEKAVIGFLADYTTPAIITEAMAYVITGDRPSGVNYVLRNTHGYPKLLGAMLWNANLDRIENYKYSNAIGPELRSYSAPR